LDLLTFDIFDLLIADPGVLTFRQAITEEYDPLGWALVMIAKLVDSPLVIVRRRAHAIDNNEHT
jgi:hypothetical protein